MVLWRKQITTQARISKIAAIILGLHAGIAQLVERNLAKVEVASSRLVSRSSFARNKNFQKPTNLLRTPSRGAVAKRLCTGLQIRVGRFDSGPRLHIHNKQAL